MLNRNFFLLAFLLTFACVPANTFAQDWKLWSTTPVFDGGRTMPLSSFAGQIVRDVCGSSRPFLVPDDTILSELNRVVEAQPRARTDELEPMTERIRRDDTLPELNAGMGIDAGELQRRREDASLKIRGMSRSQAEHIILRINTLLPQRGRYFEASELLLSWMAEPEVWDYIPIFEASESDYRKEILGVPELNNARISLTRVAVFQLEQSPTYQRRLLDIHRKRNQPGFREHSSPFDVVTERIAVAHNVFQELTFDPTRHYPSRMVELLKQAGSAGTESRYSSYELASETWNYLLHSGDDPTRHLSDDGRKSLHPTTERWEAISRKISQLTTAFDRFDDRGDMLVPNLDRVEKQFDLLLEAVDAALDESASLMERAYPGIVFHVKTKDGSVPEDGETLRTAPTQNDIDILLPRLFSDDGRKREDVVQRILVYHFAVKTLRREIETAYLALYDNAIHPGGRTLRVLPIISGQTLDGDDLGMGFQPWCSLRMVLSGGDAVVRRFLDPEFPLSTTDLSATELSLPLLQTDPALSVLGGEGMNPDENGEIVLDDSPDRSSLESADGVETEESAGTNDEENTKTGEEKNPADERFEIELFVRENALDAMYSDSSDSAMDRPATTDSIRWIRVYFDRLYTAFRSTGRENTTQLFREAGTALQQSLREAAVKIDEQRSELAADEKNHANAEYLAKTKYSAPNAVVAEYRYFRLSPIFWMWIFAAISIGIVLISLLVGFIRRDMIEISSDQNRDDVNRSARGPDGENESSWRAGFSRPDFANSAEEYIFWLGIAVFGLSIFVTLWGSGMRAWITGWAPITNMYETIVLMAFSASLLGLWYALYPLVHPALQLAWRYGSFPTLSQLTAARKTGEEKESTETDGQYAMRQAAQDFGVPGAISSPGAGYLVDSMEDPVEKLEKTNAKRTMFWQFVCAIPRLVLMLLTFIGVVYLSYGEFAGEHGLMAAMFQLLAVQDFIDLLVVILCIGLIVWFIPHLILTLVLFPVVLFHPSWIAADLGIVSVSEQEARPLPSAGQSEMSSVFHGETAVGHGETVDNSGRVWLNLARNQILDRKLFVVVAAAVVLIAGLWVQFNSVQFNPNIRPLTAVLRSNFWLTVHVVAIIVAYAAAMVAWGMGAVALGSAIFGRYRQESPNSKKLLPALCEQFAPYTLKLIRIALLLLALGTILGARWADYSWGRFWGWDSKEVWALITILFFAVVLHARLAGYIGKIGVMIGALYGSIVVITTWYAINFIFTNSIHSYGGGKVVLANYFFWGFIIVNIVWGLAALIRYGIEVIAHEE